MEVESNRPRVASKRRKEAEDQIYRVPRLHRSNPDSPRNDKIYYMEGGRYNSKV